MLENSVLARGNKDFRTEVQNLESKIKSKDKEIKDLQTRHEMKGAIDHKHNERDNNLFKSIFGRGAVATNSYDAKILSIIRTLENKTQHVESENRELRRTLEDYKNKESDSEHLHQSLKRERETMGDKFSAELRERVSELADENSALLRDKESLRNRLDDLLKEMDVLKSENFELKQVYEDLRREYRRATCEEGTASPEKSGNRLTKSHNSNSNSKSNEHGEQRSLRQGDNAIRAPNLPPSNSDENHLYSFRPFCDLSELTIIECRKIISEVEK